MIPGVQELREVFDSLLEEGASVVLLDGEVGRGKTYAIQNFYDQLASTFGGTWLPEMAPADLPSTTDKLMRDRKAVRAVSSGPITKEAPFVWLGACAEIDPYSDRASLELMDQIDNALIGHGFNATANYSKILGELAIDLALDVAQVGTMKTLVMAAKEIAITTNHEIGSWDKNQKAYERRTRTKALEKALSTLGSRGRRPVVVVLDDAHLAQRPTLEMLSSFLVPGVGSVVEPSYLPVGVAHRSDPVMILVAARPHAFLSPRASSGEFNRWLTEVQQSGIPFRRVTLPDGLTLEAAIRIARGSFPGAREERIQALVGEPIASKVVNPLVLRQRIVMAAQFVPVTERAEIEALDAVQLEAFPTSPLDQVRELVDGLSLRERSLVAQLAKFGPSCPWGVLAEYPQEGPAEALQQSLASGLLRTSSPDGSIDLAVVFLWDDLTLAYLSDPLALVRLTPTEPLARLVERCQGWLGRVGRSETLPARFAGSIGAMINRIAPVLGEPWSRDRPQIAEPRGRKQRQTIVNYFQSESQGWDIDELVSAFMWVLSRPSLVNDSAWNSLTSARFSRELFDVLPGALVCRLIALNDRTMPQPMHLETLRLAISMDGAAAVWRVAEVVPFIAGESVAIFLSEVGRDFPTLKEVADEVSAYEDSALSYIDYWQRSTLSPARESAWLLANAYSAIRADGEAVKVLLPFRDDYNTCLRIARLYMRLGEPNDAFMVLEQFPARPYGIVERMADLRAAREDFETAIRLVEPYCEGNSTAISKKAQYLSQSGNSEAALALLESQTANDHHYKEFITVLRSRITGVDRAGVLDHAEKLWRDGQRSASMTSLEDHLQDSVILAVWAEYKTAQGEREDALDALSESLANDPRLADSYVEISLESPETAQRWINRHHANQNRRVHQGLLRLEWMHSGAIPLGDWLAARSSSSVNENAISFEAPRGGSVNAISHTAVSAERAGDPLWAMDILAKRQSNWVLEGHLARLFVDYGLWDRAELIFEGMRNNCLEMCVAHTMWHLANGDLEGAGNAMSRQRNASPQLERLAQLLPRVSDPFQTIRAWRLALQLRLYPLGVSILAAGPREDIQVERAYRSHRMAQPDQRRAYSRLRRRYAIRGARPGALASAEDATAPNAPA